MLVAIAVAVLVHAAAGLEQRPVRQWDGGYGRVHSAVQFHARCPPGLGGACRDAVDPVARLVRVETGSPPWERQLCLDLTGVASGITVFDREDAESGTFSPQFGGSDLVDFGPLTLRLPFTRLDSDAVDPVLPPVLSPLCEGLVPLHAASPLWMFWPNVSVSLSSVVLGDSHRELGHLIPYDSPVLDCEPLAPGLCTTRALVLGTEYRIVLDSGSDFTVVPPGLYEQITLLRAFQNDSDSLELRFPPEPVDLGDCVERYRALGFAHADRCGDGTGQFVLRLPFRDFVYTASRHARQLLLRSADPALAEADARRHGNTSTIWLGVNVWRHVRVHVNHRAGEMVMHRHEVRGTLPDSTAILVIFLAIVLLAHQVIDTHLVWLHSTEIAVTVVHVLVLELFVLGTSGYALHADETARAFADSAPWILASLIGVVWALNGITAALILAFVFEVGAHHRTVVNRWFFQRPVTAGEYHMTERLMMVRKFTVGTAGLLALWMLLLQRREDNLGDPLAAFAVYVLFLVHLLFFVRVIVVEYHAFVVLGRTGGQRTLYEQSRGYAALWLVFLVLAAAATVYSIVLGAGLTIYPLIEEEADTSASAAIALTVFSFAVVLDIAVFFFNGLTLFFLSGYRDTVRHVQLGATPVPVPAPSPQPKLNGLLAARRRVNK
jgi:hypothetical protein